jgi:hypothetical protein
MKISLYSFNLHTLVKMVSHENLLLKLQQENKILFRKNNVRLHGDVI